MRSPEGTSRACLCIHFLLLSALLVQAPLAAGQGAPFPLYSHLAPDVRSRLAEAAGDSTLEPWQRDFMLGVAGRKMEDRAAAPSPALPGATLPPAGILVDDGAWVEFPPHTRDLHTAIYDPVRDRVVVFGGYDGSGFRNDVWALSLAGSPAWSALSPAGSPPVARIEHTAIYDPVRDRMVVFGGYDGSIFRNDVWALSLAGSPAWSALSPAGGPPAARLEHTAIYDPVRDRMVLFGGNDPSNDVWALSLAGIPAWSELNPSGTPPPARCCHTAIYDPVRDRMVVFGGADGNNYSNGLWALSLAESPAWSALAPSGSPPSGRNEHTAIYDPVRDRMVVFGGEDATIYRNDVWALSLAGSPAWSELTPSGSPPSVGGATSIYDSVRDRLVMFGTSGGSSLRMEAWALGWAPPVSVPGNADTGLPRYDLARPRPNPSRGETTVDYELGEPAWVVLDVFDAHGRRVRRIVNGWFPAGRHVSMWRGDDDRGHVLGSGVYFIRMQGGGFQATRRTVRVY